MTAPARPAGLPEAAEWTDSTFSPGKQEWAFGAWSQQGKRVGEWRWWGAHGELTTEALFNSAGTLARIKHYHPNGELANEQDVSAGTEVSSRCSDPNCKPSRRGRGLPTDPRVWRAVKRVGSIPVAFDHYDRAGVLLNPRAYLELRDGGSERFWEITVEGTHCTVRSGKAGANGTTKRSSFDTAEDALAAAEKRVQKKLKAGWARAE